MATPVSQSHIDRRPKKTRQGNGTNSKAAHNRKKYRGQGKR